MQGTNVVTDVAPFVACGARIEAFLAGTMPEEERVRGRPVALAPRSDLSLTPLLRLCAGEVRQV